MKIKAFAVEEWMNAYETGAKYNIAETCVNSVSLNELFGLAGEDQAEFWRTFGEKRLTYGCIEVSGGIFYQKGMGITTHAYNGDVIFEQIGQEA